MKKIFTLIAVALMTVCANAATTTVGAEDNSTGWWSAFSDYYTVNEGEQAHITFKNYSDKAQTWDNWLLVLNVAGTERNGNGYAEYGVFRSDNWGWGTNVAENNVFLEGVNLTNNYNWDTFKEDYDGASVAMDVYNKDGIIYGAATITTAAGTVYNYSFNTTNTGTKSFGFFLTCEKAHLTDVNVTISQIPTKTIEATYVDYVSEGTTYANYNDPDWGMVPNAKFTVDYYGTDSLVIRNWMNQNLDLCVKYDPSSYSVIGVNNPGSEASYWAYASSTYYAYVSDKSYYDLSWVTKKHIFLEISFGSTWTYYHLDLTGESTGVSAVTVAAPAESVTKAVENGKLVITKNGKKYNAAGALIN